MNFPSNQLNLAISDRDQQIVQDLVQRLREALESHLRQVIVYGSRARGDHKVGSDLDVLILVDHLDDSLKQRVREIRYRVMWEEDFEPLISLLCQEETEFLRQIWQGNGLANNIQHEGCLVYEREG
jgi:predicted nucleotidyltransferase